jgi:hypothetical protein
MLLVMPALSIFACYIEPGGSWIRASPTHGPVPLHEMKALEVMNDLVSSKIQKITNEMRAHPSGCFQPELIMRVYPAD